VKAGCGRTARPVWAADGGQPWRGASSDPTPAKPPNKAAPEAAEVVEGRAEGNTAKRNTARTHRAGQPVRNELTVYVPRGQEMGMPFPMTATNVR
jgi:hypothetical protein